MPRPKVVVSLEVMDPNCLDPLREVADVVVIPPDEALLRRELADAHAYMTSLKIRVTPELLDAAPNLKLLFTPSTGTDHIDLPAVQMRGIAFQCIKNDRELLDRVTATAELAWGLLLSVVRKLPWAFDAAKRGHWARDEFRGHQLAYRNFGVLGYGRLGTMTAQYAKAFRMNVYACDVREVCAPGIVCVDKETLFRECDVISVHVHLTPENTGLVGRREFAMMKPGSVLINTSRGAVIDEAAFLEALRHGPLAGAGIDVVHGEWAEDMSRHPLIEYARSHENLVISPHIGGVTFESQAMTYRHAAAKAAEYFRKNPV